MQSENNLLTDLKLLILPAADLDWLNLAIEIIKIAAAPDFAISFTSFKPSPQDSEFSRRSSYKQSFNFKEEHCLNYFG